MQPVHAGRLPKWHQERHRKPGPLLYQDGLLKRILKKKDILWTCLTAPTPCYLARLTPGEYEQRRFSSIYASLSETLTSSALQVVLINSAEFLILIL